MRNESAQTKQICVICARQPATTADHIPPKSIYTKLERRTARYNLHTVPACKGCNNKANVNDEEFKVFLGLTTSRRSANQKDLLESVVATVANNHRIANAIFSTAQIIYTPTSSHTLEQQVGIEFERKPYNATLRKITRAIYWRMTGMILSPETEIVIADHDLTVDSMLPTYRDCAPQISSFSANGGTFKCKLIKAGDLQVMEFTFFDKHVAISLI
jgi:hypothetical protein